MEGNYVQYKTEKWKLFRRRDSVNAKDLELNVKQAHTSLGIHILLAMWCRFQVLSTFCLQAVLLIDIVSVVETPIEQLYQI